MWFFVIILGLVPWFIIYCQCITDSTEKNDSSEVSINDDTNEISSSENDGETLEAGESNEDDTPSVEIADEPYVSQLSVEDLDDKPDESSEDVASGPQDEGSVEQSENNEQTEDGDSKEDGEASAEETAEQGIYNNISITLILI